MSSGAKGRGFSRRDASQHWSATAIAGRLGVDTPFCPPR